MNTKSILVSGSVLGFLTVALGAFGAHALNALLTSNGRLDTYELATRYMMFHTAALLVIGILHRQNTLRLLGTAALSILLGVVLFSGSLYMLSLTNIKTFAYFTPVGGVLLLLGWGQLIVAAVKIFK